MKQLFSVRLPRWRYHLALLAMLVAIYVPVSAFLLASNAQAASQTSYVVVLDALHPGESVSQVLSSGYVAGNQPLAALAKSTLIIKLFPDNNWKGGQCQFMVPEALALKRSPMACPILPSRRSILSIPMAAVGQQRLIQRPIIREALITGTYIAQSMWGNRGDPILVRLLAVVDA
ncbi:hypothetical protein [Reticulibacter mediterranei]|uniref:hypothetical protein n=1 Tax=Reticulibacter mediterranei TaxID=2778369 RepID=UPI001C68E17B|nr:hypothetical protein [Reticulibacter mediterranei]